MWMKLTNKYQQAEPALSGDGGVETEVQPVDEEIVDSDQWGDIVEDELPGEGNDETPTAGLEEGAETAEAEAEDVTPDAEPQVPAEAEETEPAAEVTPEVEAEVETPQPEPTPEEETPQPETEEELEQPAPEVSAEERQALYKAAHEELVKKYQLSEEDTELYTTEPERILPQIAADIHLQIYNDVVNSIMQYIPGVIQQQMTVRKTGEERDNAFFTRWPELKTHKADIGRFATIWRQMNPKATVETAVEEIGKHMSIALGLPVGGEKVIDTNLPPVKSAPHIPAGQSNVTDTPPAKPKGPTNEWAEFAEDLDED